MKSEIIVVNPTLPRQMDILSDVYALHRYDQASDKQALLGEVGDRCTAMVCSGHFDLNSAFLTHLPALKIVACSSVGYDAIDVDALTERDIRFTNTPDVLTDDVADIAILLMLAVRRRLRFGDQYVRSGDWASNGMMDLTRRTAGSRVGIIGLGRIGQAIATRCAAMQQEIGYFGRRQKPQSDHRFFTDLAEMADWADVLIAAVPGGDETSGLVSDKVIDALGREGTFINISRGSVVDEAALISALQGGRLAAAGLDVFLNEPNVDAAFSSMENVVLYPHHASGTVETRDAMSQLVVDNLAAFYAGKPLLTSVN